MALTFGMTGMDAATENSLKAAFTEANQTLGNAWKLVPDAEADHVVVDMDSMYGPMSWLRLHASGKHVIGLTSAPRTQADSRLAQPFDAASLATLLQELAPASDAVPAGLTPAPEPQDRLPEEQPRVVAIDAGPAGDTEEVGSATGEPGSTAVAQVVPAAPTIQPHEPAQAAPEPQPDPEPRTLAEWLASGRLQGKRVLERDGTALLIDNTAHRYHGPAGLKPLATHVTDELTEADFVEAADWDARAAALEPAQPLRRLVWFAGLLAGGGTLMPGFDPQDRFQMLKWPQTEREYPKHFRIATVMMKGPATLAQIAEASGVPEPDVVDFVNASLATGYADVERPPEPEPESPARTGLFGRLRGR